METEFHGRAVIVTGAARGIGRGIALRLAAVGANVAIADVNLAGAKEYDELLGAESVEAEIRALGRQSLSFEGDLSDAATAEALVARAVKVFGRLDILVNCAGGATIPIPNSFPTATTDAETRLVFDANYFSMVNCCRAAARQMIEQRSGSIINIASVSGYRPPNNGALAHYGAAKAAMTNFTRSLAGELGPHGVRVNAVAPGIVMSSRVKASAAARGIGTPEQLADTPMGRFAEPDDVAKVVQFFASDLSGFVTGECLAVSGGQTMVAN